MAAAALVFSSIVIGCCAVAVVVCIGITTDPSVTVAPLVVADISIAAMIWLIVLGVECGACKLMCSIGRALLQCALEIGKVVRCFHTCLVSLFLGVPLLLCAFCDLFL